jgi:hypothetical protein
VRSFLVVAVGLIPALAGAQGLGGAARQEADRRTRAEGESAEVRSYSNADLGLDEEVEEQESHTEVTATAADQSDLSRLREQLDRASARRKERERKWRGRVAAARAKLTAAQKDHEVACNPGSIALRGG